MTKTNCRSSGNLEKQSLKNQRQKAFTIDTTKQGRALMERKNEGQGADEMSAHRDCYLDMEVDSRTERYFTGERWK